MENTSVCIFAAKEKFPPLATDTEVNSCSSIRKLKQPDNIAIK